MKIVLLLLSLVYFCDARAGKTTFDGLVAVNKCWTEQAEASTIHFPSFQSEHDRDWIKLHLHLVERTLRDRPCTHLSVGQQANRKKCLDALRAYRQAGRFPINDQYNYRTPIFIDKYDNFCAVGYLIKASGHSEISRKIAAKTNLAYVREMNYPELDAWANENGFTKDELAWIQPGYAPTARAEHIGKGVDGTVYELFPDADTLYVGGLFNKIDSTISANNIAYITENAGHYTWHAMGTGVNGAVYAVTKFDGKIFIAGHFDMAGDSTVANVAYWERGQWHYAGCTYGQVKDLIVFKNNLYAAGQFDVCAALADINFARYEGNSWQQIPGLSGRVNTMEAADSVLVLGGSFSYNSDTVNVIKWNGTAFSSFATPINAEVNDIDNYNGTLYAATAGATLPDTVGLFWNLYNNAYWNPELDQTRWRPFNTSGNLSLNTLCQEAGGFMAGGNFNYSPWNGYSAHNTILLRPNYLSGEPSIPVGGSVNKIVQFKADLIIGGSFAWGTGHSTTNPFYGEPIRLNGICKRFKLNVSVPLATITQTIKIYPNPTTSSSIIFENNFNATEFSIQDVSGRCLYTNILRAAPKQHVQLPNLPSGLYLFRATNSTGEAQIGKLIIR